MKRTAALFLAALMLAAFSAVASAERYDRYDRYDRGAPPPPPPPPRAAYAPPPQHAMYGQPYIAPHLGLFEPNDRFDGLEGYDSGFNLDVAFGSRISPIFAFEGTVGAFGADRGDDEVRVVPITIGGRLIIPNPFIEPYFTGGFGIYSASLDEPSTGIDDSDATFGGYLGGGVDFWLGPRVALNVEGKYHMVEPTFNSVDVDLSGWTVGLGVRISLGH
jgi:opacity protein-like surface antigen